MDTTILMPIYNDWDSALVLIGRIVSALAPRFQPRFLLVNDGSSIPPPPALPKDAEGAFVEVLHLRRNLGHQRAITIGLAHLQQARTTEQVVVMDGDGEDTAEGVARLLEHFVAMGRTHTVFAARGRRTEGRAFVLFYVAYRVAHRVLTGRAVREGNFCVLPMAHLDRLVAVSETWNHFSASIFKARLPIASIAIDRGTRIAGRSHMNFLALLQHGLSAISVFSDVVGLRLLVATGLLGLLTLLAVVTVAVIRLATQLAVPGWATTATGLLVLLLSQAGLLSLVFVFIVLQSRNTSSFIPLRDHAFFIDRLERLE